MLAANAVIAAEKTAYAVYCGGGETPTLYFMSTDKEPPGASYHGEQISNEWEIDITGSGTEWPEWNAVVKGALKRVVFETSFSEVRLPGCYSWFIDCAELVSVEGMENLNTSDVKTMAQMFFGCSSLKTLDVSALNTAGVEDMSYMFSGCSSLESLDLSSFDTSDVTSMGMMFSGCSGLKELNLSNFNISSNIASCDGMFKDCNNLMMLDMSNAGGKIELLAGDAALAGRGMMIVLPGNGDITDGVSEENYIVILGKGTSFVRTFTKGSMSTLCLPFAASVSPTDGTLYEYDAVSGNDVYFKKVESGTIEPGKAYLFKPEGNAPVSFTSNTAMTGLPADVTEGDDAGLYGTYSTWKFEDKAAEGIYYGWAEGKFWRAGAGATVKHNRAYLKVPKQDGGVTPTMMYVKTDGEITAIGSIMPAGGDASPSYDLNGRRVSGNYKGIVIKKGRKVGPLPAGI